MMKVILRVLALMTLLNAAAIISGCGSGGSGSSSSGSLTLALDKSTVESGGAVVATVTLTASTGQPVNNVSVRVMTSNSNVMNSATGTTNIDGKAYIHLSAKWLASDQQIYLVAGSDVTGNSSSAPLLVTAPKLAATLPATSSYAVTNGTAGAVVRVVLQGTTLKFTNGASLPIVNQSVDFTITSITNQRTGDIVVFFPSSGTIQSPTGILQTVTDNTGTANIPMAVDVVIPSIGSQHVITINWQGTTEYAGNTYIITGSSQFTVVNSEG